MTIEEDKRLNELFELETGEKCYPRANGNFKGEFNFLGMLSWLKEKVLEYQIMERPQKKGHILLNKKENEIRYLKKKLKECYDLLTFAIENPNECLNDLYFNINQENIDKERTFKECCLGLIKND